MYPLIIFISVLGIQGDSIPVYPHSGTINWVVSGQIGRSTIHRDNLEIFGGWKASYSIGIGMRYELSNRSGLHVSAGLENFSSMDVSGDINLGTRSIVINTGLNHSLVNFHSSSLLLSYGPYFRYNFHREFTDESMYGIVQEIKCFDWGGEVQIGLGLYQRHELYFTSRIGLSRFYKVTQLSLPPPFRQRDYHFRYSQILVGLSYQLILNPTRRD